MSGRDSLAFFAGLGNGYLQQDQRNRDQARQQANDDYVAAQRQREADAQARQDAQRQQLAAAAAPQAPVAVMAHDASADDRDVGQSGTTLAPTGAFTVGGRSYANQPEAQTAAATANTPTAQMGRFADVMSANGDPVAAAQLRNTARQQQLGDLQLSAAQAADLKQRTWNDANTRIKSPEDLADFVSQTKGDGQGGGVKAVAVRNKDGSFTINRVADDGSTTPLGSYKSIEDGKLALLGAMTPEMMLTHVHQQATEAQAADALDAQREYQQGMLKNNADKVAMSLELAQMRAAKTGAKGDPADKMDEADRRQYQSALKTSESLQAKIADARAKGAEGGWNEDIDPKTGMSSLTAGQKALLRDAAMARKQSNDIYNKYYGEASDADPLGLSKPAAARAASSPAPSAAPAAPPAPAATMAADPSPRARRAAFGDAQNRARQDSDVQDLQRRIDGASSGRAAIGLKAQLAALTQQRYGF